MALYTVTTETTQDQPDTFKTVIVDADDIKLAILKTEAASAAERNDLVKIHSVVLNSDWEFVE